MNPGTVTSSAPVVMVVGVMRSGTSAISGALAACGLSIGDDADSVNVFNPTGYFESRQIAAVNQASLDAASASWYAPPQRGYDCLADRGVTAVFDEATGRIAEALPPGACLFKDPKAGPFLPLWRRCLEGLGRPAGAVFVWRDPEEMAVSAWRSNRLPVEHGLALWAEGNAVVASNIAGMAAFVCRYEEVMRDPAVLYDGAARLVELLGAEPGVLVRPRGEHHLSGGLQHEKGLPEDHPAHLLSESLAPWVSFLEGRSGLHERFDAPESPGVPEWATALIDAARRDHAEILEARRSPVASDKRTLRPPRDALPAARCDPDTGGQRGRPLISVIVPVWRPQPEHFRRMLSSVHRLCGTDVDVCLCDDASGDPSTANILAFAGTGIRVICHSRPRGLNEATKSAYGACNGEFVAFLAAEDQILPGCLSEVAHAIEAHRNADVLYTDEDKIDLTGVVFDPWRKEGWSADLLLTEPYLGRLLVVRRSLLDRCGGIGDHYPDDEGFDIMLRATEHAREVVHVPVVGYRFSWTSEPQPGEPSRLPWSHGRMRRSLEEALVRRSMGGLSIVSGPVTGAFRLAETGAR